jgi:hypothetical protein
MECELRKGKMKRKGAKSMTYNGFEVHGRFEQSVGLNGRFEMI